MAMNFPARRSRDVTRPDDTSRWSLVRRLLIFQVKLFADSLRDFVLSPVSFVIVAVSLLLGRRNPHGLFDRLMQAGQITDNWIDLFGHHAKKGDRPSLEGMIDEIERVMREDHARGGVTAEAEKKFRILAEEIRRRAAGSDRQGFAE